MDSGDFGFETLALLSEEVEELRQKADERDAQMDALEDEVAGMRNTVGTSNSIAPPKVVMPVKATNSSHQRGSIVVRSRRSTKVHRLSLASTKHSIAVSKQSQDSVATPVLSKPSLATPTVHSLLNSRHSSDASVASKPSMGPPTVNSMLHNKHSLGLSKYSISTSRHSLPAAPLEEVDEALYEDSSEDTSEEAAIPPPLEFTKTLDLSSPNSTHSQLSLTGPSAHYAKNNPNLELKSPTHSQVSFSGPSAHYPGVPITSAHSNAVALKFNSVRSSDSDFTFNSAELPQIGADGAPTYETARFQDEGYTYGFSYDDNDGSDDEMGDEEDYGEDELEWVQEDLYELPDDVFTMMFFAEQWSMSFVYGLTIFFSQILILSTISIDLLASDSRVGEHDNNPFNLPLEVPWQVRIAQITAILISVAQRDDCTDTFNIVQIGYKGRWGRQFKGATLSQFVLMNVLRFAQGAFVILVSFIFIVQSDNVLDLFLNFAAIEFVAGLDNLAYKLAAEGWVLASLQKLCADIDENHKLVLNQRDKEKLQAYPFLKHSMFIVFLLSLYAGLFKVYIIGLNGKLLEGTTCGVVEISFGENVFSFQNLKGFEGFEKEASCVANDAYCFLQDSNRPIPADFNTTHPRPLQLDFFSGSYQAFYGRADRRYLRPIYYERGFKDPTSGKFYYCEAEKAWVFTIEALATSNAILDLTKTRCGDDGWFVRSPVTEAIALDEAPTEGWKIWTGSKLEELQDFSSVCAECNSHIDCGVTKGTCEDAFCVCEDGYVGDFCEEESPCTEVAYYLEGEARTLSAFVDLQGYDRPIYTNSSSLMEDDDLVELVIYTGRRWYASLYSAREVRNVNASLDDPKTRLNRQNFGLYYHSYWNNVVFDRLEAYSEQTDSYSPTGDLEWTRVLSSHSVGSYDVYGAKEEAVRRMECLSVDCQRARVCGFNGRCDQVDNIAIFGASRATNMSGGQCICEGNFSGHFCEFANVVELGTNENDTLVVVDGPFELDPFHGACAGPFANLTNCVKLFYPKFIA